MLDCSPVTRLSIIVQCLEVRLQDEALHSWVSSWPYPQTLDKSGKACQGETL
jgi:hypothetical protein